MLEIIITALNNFIQEMLKYKILSALMLFLYVSVIFITVSVVCIYKDNVNQEDRILVLERN